MATLIHCACRGTDLYSADVAKGYRQFPIDPANWPLVCFQFEGRFFTIASLTFGLRWTASHCQDVTSVITRELGRQGLALLNYIDDFGGVAATEAEAACHFGSLQALLEKLVLQEAKH